MKHIQNTKQFFKRIFFGPDKSLISLGEIHHEACIHLSFGDKTPTIGRYRAQISDSLLLRGDKIVRIGSRASKDVFWVVSGLEEIPFSVEFQMKWFEKIIRHAPDKHVAIVLTETRNAGRLRRRVKSRFNGIEP